MLQGQVNRCTRFELKVKRPRLLIPVMAATCLPSHSVQIVLLAWFIPQFVPLVDAALNSVFNLSNTELCRDYWAPNARQDNFKVRQKAVLSFRVNSDTVAMRTSSAGHLPTRLLNQPPAGLLGKPLCSLPEKI